MKSYFVPPPYLELDNFNYLPSAKTYSQYNYLTPGIGSFLRRRHLEFALLLTREYFHKCSVIDFGCADGPFLPSLSKYFDYVIGVDREPKFIELASRIARNLPNVEIIDNSNLGVGDLKAKLKKKFHILFLLETLEHVGNENHPWEFRVKFVEELFNLIDKDGIIVISVPNMVGIPFLVQRAGLFLFNAERDKLSMPELLRATFLNDTTTLEQRWQEWHMSQTRHIGFNHQKLESYLREKFNILKVKNIFFQILYVIGRKDGEA
jgi:2-polyprenyl-3-methyl-5-hydroxy-6-metoxy-1,4-benzoquinol methylase